MEPRPDPQKNSLGFRSLVNTVHLSSSLSKKGLFVKAVACQLVLPTFANEVAAAPIVSEPLPTTHEQAHTLDPVPLMSAPSSDTLALAVSSLPDPTADTFSTLLPTQTAPALPIPWQTPPSDESTLPIQHDLAVAPPPSSELPVAPIADTPSIPVPDVIQPIVQPQPLSDGSSQLPLFQVNSAEPQDSLTIDPHPVDVPILIAGPQGLNPGLSQTERDSVEPLPVVVPITVPPALPQQSNTTEIIEAEDTAVEPNLTEPNLAEPNLTEPTPIEANITGETSPFVRWDDLEVGIHNSFGSFGESSWKINPTLSGQLANGDTVKVSTGFNQFTQDDVEPVTHLPLTLGWQGTVSNVGLAFEGGVDFFSRLPTTVHFSTSASLPLGETAVLSMNLEQGPYDFNARTLENEISTWRYGPNLSWQITPEVSLFSQFRIGNYSDGNWEQQSYSRLERKIAEEAAVALTLTNLSFQENVESTSGYFSPPDFLIATAELSWREQLTQGLSCGLTGSLGQQRLEGEWALAYNNKIGCTIDVLPALQLDLGYRYSNVSNDQSALAEDSAYSNQEIIAGVRLKF